MSKSGRRSWVRMYQSKLLLESSTIGTQRKGGEKSNRGASQKDGVIRYRQLMFEIPRPQPEIGGIRC